MLHESALGIATKYWAGQFGCAPQELFAEPRHIVTHGPEFQGYDGIFALFRGESAIASVPQERAQQVRKLIDKSTDALTAHSLSEHLAPVTDYILGPAHISYATKVPAPALPARPLLPEDSRAVQQLQAACAPSDWECGGSAIEHPASGMFVHGELVSRACYEIWGGMIAQIFVVTHPRFRNRGYGRSVVAHIARRALHARLLPQYRSLENNGAALRIGHSLGFQSYARSMSIHLIPSAAEAAPLAG